MTVASTNPPMLNAISAPMSRMPATNKMSSTNTQLVSGTANWRPRLGSEARHGREHQEPEEEVADARLREGVDARDHARARDERAEDREQPRPQNQREIPFLQHAPFFLDHDRMEEGRHDQPRQERRIFDGIPRPIAAPSQFDVRPPHPDE